MPSITVLSLSGDPLTLDFRTSFPSEFNETSTRIRQKYALKKMYNEAYSRFSKCLLKCPKDGLAVEIGAGLGYAKRTIPELIITDVIQYPSVDMVVNAEKLPFKDNSIKFIGINNALHHIPNAEAFFYEVSRCLKPEGRISITDVHGGILSAFIYTYLHHEGFDRKTKNWQFSTKDPLKDANGALAWILFKRDLSLFQKKYPKLDVLFYQPHTPLMYWMAGGLKKWCLVDKRLYSIFNSVDKILIKIHSTFGCFVNVEIVKR